MSHPIDDLVDLRQFFYKILNNWPPLLLSLIISFAIAYSYLRYADEIFNVQTTVLISEENSLGSTSDLLFENLSSNKKSLENKELLIRSYPIVNKTLKDLRFDIGYFDDGKIKTTETYQTPFYIKCKNTKALKNKSFKITVIDKKSFVITDLSSDIEQSHRFNQKFLFSNQELMVKPNLKYISNNFSDLLPTIVKFYDLQDLTLKYQKKLEISRVDKKSTVISISINTLNERKGVVFLNKLIENYINYEVEEKNLASINTVDFINNQLHEIRDSLDLIEEKIQNFKNNNQITDLSLKAQGLNSSLITIETELAKTLSISNYFDYINEYLDNGVNLDGISVPALFGIEDERLNSLINQIISIQIKKNVLIDGGQNKNPAIKKYTVQIAQLILNLKEAIKTSKSTNNIQINDFNDRIENIKSSLKDIPEVEMELLAIERLQSISENLYIFLLQKRAEAKITLSSNISDSKVLEPAIFFDKDPILPNKRNIFIIALLCGFFFPLILLFIWELFNDKIHTKGDLEKLTSIPVLAVIGKNNSDHTLLSKQSPKSAVYEGFRALRSNLNYFNKSKDKKVYLVTSSISGEGKTYIAANLGIVYAKSGLKTLVIGADLRKPKLYAAFNLENTFGITNHLLSDSPLKDIIIKSEIDGLDILISGPIPQNPSDALLTDKFKNMMKELKSMYDIILLDTPPLGLVADALTLMKYSDINLYVSRQNYTKIPLLTYINDLYKSERVENLQLILNDA
ncbi:MAG: polysaccharide biosynthesis tyrosine autokinase, partial [Flavobacteriales bacterium]|nr:polysaccharide biosynthesis tyrosine autokinase [Flavobacteriales bacterium]